MGCIPSASVEPIPRLLTAGEAQCARAVRLCAGRPSSARDGRAT
ncbi:hypothetical protein ACFPRL_10880 [Pseudoclavibacter helvolus]